MYSAARGDEESVLHLLRSGVIDVNALDSNGCSALHFASRFNNIEVVKAIVKKRGVRICVRSDC